jgi:four helix bundle protein
MVTPIERRDPDLAPQLRRAAIVVVLNLAEGSGSFGRVRTVRYVTALGSARETLVCLRVAEGFGYVQAVPDAVLDSMHRVVGTLVRVVVESPTMLGARLAWAGAPLALVGAGPALPPALLDVVRARRALLGIRLVQLRAHLAPTGIHLVHPRAHLAPTAMHLVHPRAHLAPTGIHLVHPRAHLAPTAIHLVHRCTHLARTGVHLVHRCTHLARTDAREALHRAHLGRPCARLVDATGSPHVRCASQSIASCQNRGASVPEAHCEEYSTHSSPHTYTRPAPC